MYTSANKLIAALACFSLSNVGTNRFNFSRYSRECNRHVPNYLLYGQLIITPIKANLGAKVESRLLRTESINTYCTSFIKNNIDLLEYLVPNSSTDKIWCIYHCGEKKNIYSEINPFRSILNL